MKPKSSGLPSGAKRVVQDLLQKSEAASEVLWDPLANRDPQRQLERLKAIFIGAVEAIDDAKRICD